MTGILNPGQFRKGTIFSSIYNHSTPSSGVKTASLYQPNSFVPKSGQSTDPLHTHLQPLHPSVCMGHNNYNIATDFFIHFEQLSLSTYFLERHTILHLGWRITNMLTLVRSTINITVPRCMKSSFKPHKLGRQLNCESDQSCFYSAQFKYVFFTFVLSLRNEELAVVQIFKKDVLSYLEIMKFMNKQISPMK